MPARTRSAPWRSSRTALYALHLKDFKKLPGDDKWEDVPAGDATLDVDGVVKFLLANKSEAPVFIEYEGGNPVVSSQKSLDRVKAGGEEGEGVGEKKPKT